MKVALVCDFLTKLGGAQRVLLALSKLYPEAPIYCMLYDEKGTKGEFKGKKIIPSHLQKYPAFLRSQPKLFLGKLSFAVEQFNFSEFDVVISSSDSFAHGIITKPNTFHICYCHTPMRYAWDWYHNYLKENNIGYGLKGLYVRNLLYKIRIWDRTAAHRVDKWLANSENVKVRIKKYYQTDSTVVYPPVDIEKINIAEKDPDDYYLIVSRLEPYKKIDLAIEAFNSLDKKLKIIGEGSDSDRLRKIANKNISFLDWQKDEAVFDYLRKCKALIFPGEEDFGLTIVEALAAGRPVIAYSKGGAIESILPDETGLFFEEDSPESLIKAVNQLEKDYGKFKPENCRKQAEKFSLENFNTKIKKEVEVGLEEHRKNYA